MQRVEYVEIPSVKPKDYYLILRQIYNHIISKKPSFKMFRRWMREKGWWDKENAELLMFMMDLKPTDPVQIGKFGQKLVMLMDESEAREAIGRRLVDMNPLLAKYCLEAMDVENEGKIQSSRELFKMVDSFVYPGEKLKLRHFNAWVAWAEAGNLIRLIGIRWGLTDFAKRILPQLRALDPDEFLEDEEDGVNVTIFGEVEGELDEEGGEQEVDVQEETPAEAVEQDEVGEEKEVVEAPKEVEKAPEVVKEVVEDVRGEAVKVEVARQRFVYEATTPDIFVIQKGVRVNQWQLKDTAKAVKDWWDNYGGKRLFNFKGLIGDMKEPAQMAIAMYVALLVGRGYESTAVSMMAAQLNSLGVFKQLGAGKISASLLKTAYQVAYDEQAEAMVEALGFVGAAIKGLKGLKWGDYKDPKELIGAVHEQVFFGVGGLAPFVLIREAYQAGLIEGEVAKAGFIPFYNARLQAFRLGFLNSVYAEDFNALKEIALGLVEYFGEDVDFEQPLLHMPLAFGCRFGCGNTANCPFTCREKGPYNV